MIVFILETYNLKGIEGGRIGRRHESKGTPIQPLQVMLDLTTQPLEVMMGALTQPLQVILNLTTQPLEVMPGAHNNPLQVILYPTT